MLLGYARRLLKLNEESVTRFLAPPIKGTVRFGTTDDQGSRLLPEVLSQLYRLHPAVQSNVVVGGSLDMQRQLEVGELDLILMTAGSSGQTTAQGESMHTEPLVWAGREGGVATRRSPLPMALGIQEGLGVAGRCPPSTLLGVRIASPAPANTGLARRPRRSPISP